MIASSLLCLKSSSLKKKQIGAWRLVALLIFTGLFSTLSVGHAFDCRQAKQTDEVIICADSNLKALDNELG